MTLNAVLVKILAGGTKFKREPIFGHLKGIKHYSSLFLNDHFATNSIVVLVRARDGGRVGCVCNAAAETVSFSAAYQDRKLAP